MLDYIILALCACACIFSLCALFKKNDLRYAELDRVKRELLDELRATRAENTAAINSAVKAFAETQSQTQQQLSQLQNANLQVLSEQLSMRQDTLQRTVYEQLHAVDERFKAFSLQSEQRLDNIRTTMEGRLTLLQQDNNQKLEQMRQTVDEKLQKTLDDKLKQSFSLVSERLEQVYKGLGEMQTLANGVGDLKKVLSNVKTRGILGEIQLGAILEQILSPEQYEENIATKKGSADRVEFAVKLPGDESGPVYLPIDAKFPADAYAALVDAYDSGDASAVDSTAKILETRIKGFAKDIHDKYISVPETTDFAIMFLPVEGLYAEVVRRGLVEKLQADYKVNIAGPTTMAALLNSLQMGFKTLAIQKRSSEVWNVLSGVKSEFDTFGKALEQAKNRIAQAGDDLEKLVGVRTRQIQRKLKTVQTLPGTESTTATLLPDFLDEPENAKLC